MLKGKHDVAKRNSPLDFVMQNFISQTIISLFNICCLRSAFRVKTVGQYVQWNFCAFVWCVNICAFKLLLCVNRNLQTYSIGKSLSNLIWNKKWLPCIDKVVRLKWKAKTYKNKKLINKIFYLYEHVNDV